eukprot:TRINITY_DN2101_c0_g1::TRINITY_DN2101_c0_g1_i1::g.21901::m.21901 TRINITY_DN2101_c0_g1::TRINITY_DN2101_c0_g1_i1::g.21901  ORF type:complete len:979 (+),score=410.41,sp/P36428/SYA_ARATH/54.36/0.0,tRNA-synt_2c/PF01411.14/2.1e-210,tRNA_SAD/PF07973.9/2.7e-16,DHHA1/PF02272.14/7.8e+03,DHHA1/PF02272.14/2e-06,Ribosomal_S13/PF00416.17/3.8e+03,Ribosomal_S13/PF00416.17/0.57,Ribosomal_S13/PF00416.17/2.9e+03 TRINITY_DN2101_c0_g1_i1:85-2937(+)
MASEQWPSGKVRKTFIEFFGTKEHKFIASSPVVPHDDPTLLFANAGMNQFKPLFLGQCEPTSPFYGLKRVANSQKCIRAGGKHNDLEDVGKDTYHHTFFEMLGNWSFADFFKAEAIDWAWELLTGVYGLDKTRMYATYFGGDKNNGLDPDYEARDLWLKHLPANRVLPCGMKDNFWEMGDTGPCGPCSEIHYDRIGGREVPHLVNADSPELIEIWNLVFIQFNREHDRSLRQLPAKHVDTGMGFERLTSVLQNKMSNYDTDVFTPIFNAIQGVTGARSYTAKVGKDDTDLVDMSYRVVADHIRTLTFAITDGAIPSAEGRGYVLRRILRRAVRYGKQFLGANGPFFYKLVDVVVDSFGEFFPELKNRRDLVKEIILDEEESFLKTLEKGIEKFNTFASVAEKDGKNVINGVDAFTLYDTYGFPYDLTVLMAEERGFKVDAAEYEKAMEAAKAVSRAAGVKGGERALVLEAEQTAHLASLGVKPTDDMTKYDWDLETETTIKAIYSLEGFKDSAATGTSNIGFVMEVTPYYAESGGQIFDTGVLAGADFKIQVTNVQKFGAYILHIGTVESGTPKVGDAVTAKVDYARRRLVAPNHTFTHLMNYALRTVMGEGVEQKGSIVTEDKLRFDFNAKAMTIEQIAQVEKIVREKLQAHLDVHTKIADLATTRRVSALRAVFGEVYPDPVRVVVVGHPIDPILADPENPKWKDYSIELCGGTHLNNTKEAGAFAIIHEEGIAKGIRRITAVTRDHAVKAIRDADDFQKKIQAANALADEKLSQEVAVLSNALEQLSISTVDKENLKKDLQVLQDRVYKAFKEGKAANTEKAIQNAKDAAQVAKSKGEQLLVVRIDVGLDSKALAKAVDTIQADHAAAVMVFSAAPEEKKAKLLVYCAVPDALQSKLSAKDWLSSAMELVGGKGGGKPSNAQGQAATFDQIDQAMEQARQFASSKLL